MQYNITLTGLQYVFVLIAWGIIGSCYQTYKSTGYIRPFLARIVTGAFSGGITMIVVYKLDMESDPALLHWGVATILGAALEKKDGNNFVEKFILAFKGAK